ncbi:Methyl-CpG DNA binding [Ostreococcus tauri]|uniref:Methyl-CpG DNA binding n=1 Tax=Ostreococcus tauri TaxID=70448 RepID=Q01BC5_OSTTA|nr:Methyl-CpG DNA binding [Ostreococcus tauri]CAL51521.1 Methyl-CpG DNA binding [Ostreococcus tauri]|eukprot:XP_003078641.1 Methyl-CpG DNA binding [Ostreococcus tauri]
MTTQDAREAIRDLRAYVRAKERVDIYDIGEWRAEIRFRKSGDSAGVKDKYFYAPCGTRFRSQKDVRAFAVKAIKSAGAKSGEKRRVETVERGVKRMKKTSAPKKTAKEAAFEEFLQQVAAVTGRDVRGDGWRVELFERKSGKGGAWKEFFSPRGHKLRSMREVFHYLSHMNSIDEVRTGEEEEEEEGGEGARPSMEELEEIERREAEKHAALITRPVTALVERAAPSVQVTGVEVDEDMDEDRLAMQFMDITGFEPLYETVEELRAMVKKERAQAAVKINDSSSAFKFNTSSRSQRMTLEELPNGSRSAREEDERKRVEQRALIDKMKAKNQNVEDFIGNISEADWRGDGRVPKFLGNTSVPDIVRGGTRIGAAPQIAGTEAEIKCLPSTKPAAIPEVDRPPFDPTDTNAVSTLKAAMHTSATPQETRCRDIERAKVIDLIQGCLRDHRPGSMYLAGLPGTGKTLTLKDVQRTTEKWGISGKTRPRVVFMNCMSVHDPKAIFGLILDELNENVTATDRDPAKESVEFSDVPEIMALRRVVTEMKGGMVIILLDEMDQLVTRAQEVLYELFALPALRGSRCVLAGVSNALNLTDRVLPRLRARGCEPQLVTFAAYDGNQLKELLKQRLAVLPFNAFEDSALELCSRKVGAATGDMRKALNVCATAIDICVQEATKSTEEAHMAKGGVKIAHMARALSKTFSNPVVDSIRALPQMQQLVLCSAAKLFHSVGTVETTTGTLHDRYVVVCKTAGVKELSQGEFYNMCTALEDHALVKVGKSGNDRMRKLKLQVKYDDVVFALQGVHFFRNLLGVTNQ